MEHYEIRIVNDGKPLRVHSCVQLSDHAAVRRALTLIESTHGIEVWRAGRCVYVRPNDGSNGNI
jgi:hypothetical protein